MITLTYKAIIKFNTSNIDSIPFCAIVLAINAITAYVLEDEMSPDVIDEDEADYLYEQINGDGQIDDTERALLENIKAKAKNFPEKLASLLK